MHSLYDVILAHDHWTCLRHNSNGSWRAGEKSVLVFTVSSLRNCPYRGFLCISVFLLAYDHMYFHWNLQPLCDFHALNFPLGLPLLPLASQPSSWSTSPGAETAKGNKDNNERQLA